MMLAPGILAVMLIACAPMQTVHEPREEIRERAAVYTEFQADRGRVLYEKECARCHGTILFDGTQSPLAGDHFLAKWERDDALYRKSTRQKLAAVFGISEDSFR